MATSSNISSFGSAADWTRFLGEVLPRQGYWTDNEYLVLTEHGNRLVEFTDGYLEALPVPTASHQSILGYLYRVFADFVEPRGGWVLFAPVRLRIREGKYREPDLLLLLSADDPRRQDAYSTGADLALEVVSPDNPDRDLVQKRSDYTEGGIKEYWVVNPQTETITVFWLQGKAYTETGCYRRGEKAISNLMTELKIDAAATLDAGRLRR